MDDEWPRLPLPPPPPFDHWDDAGELAVRWNEAAQQWSYPPPPMPEWELPPPDPNWGEEPKTRRPKWPYPRAPAFGDDLCDRAAPLGLAPRDGWRIMGRIDRRVRRPGAHCGTDYDCYLKSLLPDHTLRRRRRLQSRFEVHEWAQNRLEETLLERASRIAAGFEDGGFVRLWKNLGSRDPLLIDNLNCYERERKDTMRMWWFLRVEERQRQLEMEIDGRFRIAPAGGWPPPERQRQFEKEAWRYDKGHKRVLAARRRLGRAILRRHLRRAVMTRAIALYWQEQTQRALCAPGGAGRAADAVAFTSEFA